MALGEEHLKGFGFGVLPMHLSENHLPDTIYHLRIPSWLGPEIWNRSVSDPNLGAFMFCEFCVFSVQALCSGCYSLIHSPLVSE
jgi:hypothetical protein